MRRREFLAAPAALAAAPAVKALTFDVFGTVVDWRGSIIREGASFNKSRGLEVDWARLADRWRAGYGPAMNRVRTGELGWKKIDELHRMILDSLLDEFGLGKLDEAARRHLNFVWHRLDPWPDAVAGLARLKTKYTIAPLSNGNLSLLTNMAKRAGLPWDCILSAELARHYKPDPEAYLTACQLLDLPPGEVMMVAAHPNDLHAARRVGMRTGYVPRPLEFGPGVKRDAAPAGEFDVTARDFPALATALGC
ncbi:MAG: haloacid dehalogenase type II [Acidobacteria bacterium]|nr:haloacid dehalogenase type II [Acidobacteriota bacterium]